jgi:LysM repeat protein
MNTDPLKDLKPEDARLAQKLKAAAEQIEPNPFFESQLGDQLQQRYMVKTHGKTISLHRSLSVLGWITLAIAFVALTTFMFRRLLPEESTQPVSATSLPVVPLPAATETPVPTDQPPPTLQSQSYDWRGTQLTLAQPLPESPAEVSLYQLKPDHHGTLEEARALANRFELGGEVYQSASLYPDKQDYFFTDGKQSLAVSSDFYFTYTADMSKAYNYFTQGTNPNAEKTIGDFLSSHGFDFPYKVETDELYGGYVVEPLSPDGFPMRYEYYSSRPMLFTFDENGQVLRFETNLMDYESTGDQNYSIISAEEAFYKILDPNRATGMIESMHSESKPTHEWRRAYPENQDITIHGYITSIPALDSNSPPFVQINANTATGNIQGLDGLKPNTYVEATGQFVTENGIEKFKIDSWKVSRLTEDGFIGTIKRDGNNVILVTDSGSFILPDVPNDMPLPFESAYVVGVKVGDTIEWTLIDDRMVGDGGGGGGGGGLGFYKLNLSGTPVPFPIPTPEPSGSAGESQYIVKAGDTLGAIAQANGITVDELMKANNISDPGTIYIDQQLIIPGPQSNGVGQKIDGQQGLISVTLYNEPDGSQRAEYTFYFTPKGALHSQAMLLEGDHLQELQADHNRPVEIWGTVSGSDQQLGIPIVTVERFNIQYPDLKFKIMRGTQRNIEVLGQPVTLFTSDDGRSFVQLMPSGDGDSSIIGRLGDEVILEALAIPDETYGGYPALRVFSSAMAVSPKDGQPIELTITADKPYVTDEPTPPENSTPPTATIEKVELMYFVTNQHWQVDHLDKGPQFIQPVWKFTGHYSNGDVFEILVQALKQQYLLPELAPYIQGG